MELERLNQLLQYDHLTGKLFSKEHNREIQADPDGFITIWDSLAKKKTKFKADRLCFTLGNNKKVRKNQKILHKNLNNKDNRLVNLVLISQSVHNRVKEASKNLSGGIKIQPHIKDKYDFVVSYFDDKFHTKEVYCDIIAAQNRVIVLQLKYAKVLTRYCCFE